MARIMASKPDAQLLGATEFEIRERRPIGSRRAIRTAVNERKKGYQGSEHELSAL